MSAITINLSLNEQSFNATFSRNLSEACFALGASQTHLANVSGWPVLTADIPEALLGKARAAAGLVLDQELATTTPSRSFPYQQEIRRLLSVEAR